MIELLWQIPAALVSVPVTFLGTRSLLMWGMHIREEPPVEVKPQEIPKAEPRKITPQPAPYLECKQEQLAHHNIQGMKWGHSKSEEIKRLNYQSAERVILRNRLDNLVGMVLARGHHDIAVDLMDCVNMFDRGDDLSVITRHINDAHDEFKRRTNKNKYGMSYVSSGQSKPLYDVLDL